MAWFEAHDTLGRHPKTLKLARLLNISRREAVGLLHDLFAWGLYAADKNGWLKELDAEDIGEALDFPKKQRGKAVLALVEAGFLDDRDGRYYIHDWYDYAGKLYDSREKNRERIRRYREKQKDESGSEESGYSNDQTERQSSGENGYVTDTEPQTENDCNGYVTVTTPLRNGVTVPNRTVPNQKDNNIAVVTPDARAHAREEEAKAGDDGLGKVMTLYMDRVNPMPSTSCVEALKAYTEEMGPDVVCRAIERAIDEKVLKWSYIEAILRAWSREKVRSLADLERLEEARVTARGGAPPGKQYRRKSYEEIAEELEREMMAGVEK